MVEIDMILMVLTLEQIFFKKLSDFERVKIEFDSNDEVLLRGEVHQRNVIASRQGRFELKQKIKILIE